MLCSATCRDSMEFSCKSRRSHNLEELFTIFHMPICQRRFEDSAIIDFFYVLYPPEKSWMFRYKCLCCRSIFHIFIISIYHEIQAYFPSPGGGSERRRPSYSMRSPTHWFARAVVLKDFIERLGSKSGRIYSRSYFFASASSQMAVT